MAMSSAERQARYRERQKQARHVTAEDPIKAARRRVAYEFVKDMEEDAALSEIEGPTLAERVAFIRDVTAKPLWREGEFLPWLEHVLVREIEGQISAADRGGRGRRHPPTA